MSTDGRPLSPHLTIYRWPITMVLSIMHRITGIAMSIGLLVFVLWLGSIAFEAISYGTLKDVMDSVYGQLMLLGWTFCFFFHLANGIRHLVWDTGRLLEKQQADTSAWFVLVASIVMTAGCWLVIGGYGG